mmetsp:Transcript_15072/g.49437  ORF Transcript_15072/g.49437 Transcript_15072/m.49437 type:complete len:226 (+) Transcript_15072:24-701(+)
MQREGEPRCGVYRPTQNTNVLLVHSELGKVKRCTYANNMPGGDFAFGVSKPRDAEGAREVSMKWVEHQANPDDKPGPDFISMNKMAAIDEVIHSKDQRGFRIEHPVTLKRGDTGIKTKQQKSALPSDTDPDFVYGRTSSQRPVEETRLTGDAPDIKAVVQGSFMMDWVKMNEGRQDEFNKLRQKPVPKPTKASAGHASATKTVAEEPKAAFKMSKFSKVPPRVAI